MANGHGGLRRPAQPAPASGPGALSRRTDGKQPMVAPTGMDYGQHAALMQQERTAPMPQDNAPPTPQIQSPAPGPGTPGVGQQAFDAPSARPDEPITHGVDIGPGAGPEAMSLPGQEPAGGDGFITNALTQLSPADATGTLAALLTMAQQRRA